MNKITGYADLNIPIGPECQAACEAAVKCGFLTIAINVPIVAKNVNGQSGQKQFGKKRKWEERSGGIIASTAAQLGKSSGVPLPTSPEWITELKSKVPGLRILNRLTIIFSDANELQKTLSHQNVKQYDILAVLPTNHDALQACIISTAITADIISFDYEGPHWIQKLRTNRQKGDLAATKDMFFELTYASALRGDVPLESLIYTSNSLLEHICVKRIKNLILTSGASGPLEVKSSKDIVSLGHLLGLDEATARQCIREHTHRIIQKSDARKHGKTWVAFIPATTDCQSSSQQQPAAVGEKS